ncbi:MAG: hypothetical protein Q9M89_08270 [Persephonella sp.]|nr:hypothetical protein [Persephonella sp.]
MEFVLIIGLIAMITVLVVFGLMTFQSIQDYLKENSSKKHLEVIKLINEKELIREIENDEWKPVKNIEREKNKLKKAVIDRKEKTNIKLSKNYTNMI